MDFIKIEELEVYAGHGVFSEETRKGQMFYVNAVLGTDLRGAGLKDELTLSTHYGEVCHFISRYLKEHTFLLIEAAAEHLAKALLLDFPLIRELTLEIRKPHAPIGLPLSSVSVQIKRGWKQVYLGVGSNMGDRRGYIDRAVEGLKGCPEIRNVKCSGFITTKPYGGVEQEDFLNGAIELETLLTPEELLMFLHELEKEAGRERKVHWGPRTLDLDILFYQEYVSDDPRLTVPHPDMENRMFVLVPLSQLCPYYKNPVTGQSVKQMLKELEKLKGPWEGQERTENRKTAGKA
ncbi:MAG: 2-amino-4-hydroxy-6-hydroxymethyldihydropteridine diphosphokinase [Bacillota bacterium]|nr:2-amino-4-hydroxy-6-hydroxymethyldihydropteridine diphosphokinase [Bacillota bacterium]